GLVNVLTQKFLYAEHRYCQWHMYRNFTKKFMMMKRLHVEQVKVDNMAPNEVCPRPLKRRRKRQMAPYNCFPTYNGDGQYEVQHHDRTFIVDLTGHGCACRKWQLSGLPCKHEISCISMNQKSIAEYVALESIADFMLCTR
ncbi:hypothetical protein LINGRAHAP2_LOCUS23497, partial [Linum grandiflorum]